MAVYNGELFVRDQVESIIKQLGSEDELIISDDGSTDSTFDIVRELSNMDTRIFVLKGPGKGLIRNFEFALTKARGDVIFLADQDDIWLSGKVNAFLLELKSSYLVCSDCFVTDQNLKIREKSFVELNHSGKGFFRNMIKNSYLGCCIAFRREVLTKALPFPKNIPMHDWWLGLIAETFYTSSFISTPFLFYRRHGDNASPTSTRSTSSLLTKIKYRIPLIMGIIRVKFRGRGW